MQEIALLVVPVLTLVFSSALIKQWMEQRTKSQAERVRLLEEALKNPAIDRPTIESLTFQLTGVKAPRQKQGRSWFLATVLGIGWIGLFVGITLWVSGEWINDKDLFLAGMITTIAGFGVLTYPFALRELESRRAQP